jgi:hypothetical protein
MSLTNRWFIEKKFLDGTWTDYPFNPESGYETQAQAENFKPDGINTAHGFQYRVTERKVEFPVKRSLVFKSRVTELIIDGHLYRKTELPDSFTWEQFDFDNTWTEPYFLDVPELERVLTSQT